MQTYLDCIPCFARQALEAMRRLGRDAETTERLVRVVLAELSRLEFNQPPPVAGKRIHRLIRELLDDEDPYRELKERFNRYALELYPSLARQAGESADPFETSLRLAIAGNSIDFAAFGDISETTIGAVLERAMRRPLVGSVSRLRREVEAAREILYLADNAGEIVFDRLLIERLPRDRVTVVVRGHPVINDATMEDAKAAGLTELVEVIDNGSDAPGTLLDDCSASFRRRFERADLVVAKGMGNYETLNEMGGRRIFFLLIAKCPLVAEHIGCAEGEFVVSTLDGAGRDVEG